MLRLSIVIPALNEAANIVATLRPLQALRSAGHELILADGGSDDDTIALATDLVDHIVHAPRGRARQMNAGAAGATGDVLLFLHADTTLPDNALELIRHALAHHAWGRFNVRLSGAAPMLRVVERLMNWRSRLTGICTGDQAIFIRSEAFIALGGYGDMPLMEDIDFSRRCKQGHGHPRCITTPLTTSSRRWERNGILRTIVLMWRLRLAYALGVSPKRLARQYR